MIWYSIRLRTTVKDELLRSKCFQIICTVPIFTVYIVCTYILYTNLFSDNVCTVHQFITEIKMFSDNVCTVPTVVTVSSESAREKEGEHKRQEQSWTRRRHRVCFPPFSHYQACTFHVVFFMLSMLLF